MSLGLSFVLLLVIGLARADLQLILFNNSYVQSTGARCLDGTASGYYFSPSTNPKGSSSWAIYLEGGGLCVEPIDCSARMKNHLGSSKYWNSNKSLPHSILSKNSKVNPFYDFNHVFVPYCTGDTHTGLRNTTDRFGFYFSGHLILEAIVSHLKSTTKIDSSSHILFAGGSAGGIGVFNNADWMSEKFPNAVVKGVPEAGYFWSPNIVLYQEWIFGITIPYGKIAAEYLTTFFGSYLNPNCVAAYPKNPKWCWEAGLAYPHIKTQLFIANNVFDQSQLQFVGWINDGSSLSKGYQQWFGADLVSSIQIASAVPNKTRDGFYLPACYSHTGNMCMGSTTRVQGFSFAQVLADWFFETDKLPHRLVDGCWAPNKGPCNSACPTFCG